MKQERIEYMVEDIDSFVQQIARDYADGLPIDEKVVVKGWYILEAIRLELGIPSGIELPDFFGYIAQEVMDEVARIMPQRGHEVEWYAGELIIYPLPEEE